MYSLYIYLYFLFFYILYNIYIYIYKINNFRSNNCCFRSSIRIYVHGYHGLGCKCHVSKRLCQTTQNSDWQHPPKKGMRWNYIWSMWWMWPKPSEAPLEHSSLQLFWNNGTQLSNLATSLQHPTDPAMDSTSVKHAKKIRMTWRAKSFCSQLFPFVLPRAEDEDREPMPFEPEAAGIYWFFLGFKHVSLPVTWENCPNGMNRCKALSCQTH